VLGETDMRVVERASADSSRSLRRAAGEIEMNHTVPQIGRCVGCDRPSRLSDEVCEACLTRRGRRWAEMSHRCRTDPEFALSVFDRISNDRGRALFLATYGVGTLRANASTIAGVRAKQSGRTWAWEAELTVPPPK